MPNSVFCRVLKPPGGESSNIFGDEPVMNGSMLNGKYDMSPMKTPPRMSPTKTSPRKSPDGSQDRLFGTPETDGPRRKSVDRMKSSVFNPERADNANPRSSCKHNTFPLTVYRM